jgi:opacity protein-like surface antigen
MKKLIILVSAVALSSTMFAQKATTDNPYSLEGAVNFTGSEGMTWKAPDVRLRYFFKDNLAARVTLGYISTSEEDFDVSASSIGLGVEYHLAGNDKMSPYFAGGLVIGSGSTTETFGDQTTTYKNKSLGFGTVAGLDYYVTENLYLGLEINLVSFNSNTIPVLDKNITSTALTLGGGSSIRMGWRF